MRYRRALAALLLPLLIACGPEPDAAIAPTSASGSGGGGQALPPPPAAPAAQAEPTMLAPATGAAQIASTSAPAEPAASAAPEASPAPAEGQFSNPVIDQDFPDPDLLQVGETYYAYATNSGGTDIQLATSSDLVRWQIQGEALPSLPAWARPGNTWAPEVTALDTGAYVMYFTARHGESGRQCIGAATSPGPEGPFEASGEQPLICQLDQGGSIDAASFADEDGARFLLWKNDGNCCGEDTWIYLQRVSADGLTLEGEPTQLLRQDLPWEGRLIEAPTLWKHEGRYYLFYSANSYAGLDYAVGYAVADSIQGPYQKAPEPLLTSDLEEGAAFGPGGQDVVVDDEGETWLAYHSWDPAVQYRRMQLDELEWQNGVPLVDGPDLVPQEAP